jgi:hypothetical protein
VLGSLDGAALKPEQTHIALYWQSAGGPALLWNDVASDLVEDRNSSLDGADTARLLAMLNPAGADAAINCWRPTSCRTTTSRP